MVAGNLALIQLPFGGVYLVGGVARALAPHLSRFGFADAFRDKGRFAGFMRNFGVAVIEDDYAALVGSAAHLVALRSLGGELLLDGARQIGERERLRQKDRVRDQRLVLAERVLGIARDEDDAGVGPVGQRLAHPGRARPCPA